MAKLKEREEALRRRQQGESYSQIKKILGVSKGTLSIWLRNYPLSKERIRELRDWNEQRIERFRATMRGKREERLETIYSAQKKYLLPLSTRELLLSGLCLHWGEGSKSQTNSIILSNTDPGMIRFYICWLTQALCVPKEKIKIRLQLYRDMTAKKEIEYWATILNIPQAQFTTPYFKESLQKRINHKGSFGHGTCNVIAYNTKLAEVVAMSIKVIHNSVK
ncbi:MAG: helix-turn-helix domain-containing protein [Candidatus Wildermuthbacteria bacterium]|nr:helix-turn-helix domain-containing protein [Candidatus Wildermuthbacteria bacterium]